MKFLLDAQLPRRAVEWFAESGHDAIHTFDLPQGNVTTDQTLILVADESHRVVVTKDADFVDAHLLHGRPHRLLLIATGNIANAELQTLLVSLLPDISQGFTLYQFLELGRNGLVVRG